MRPSHPWPSPPPTIQRTTLALLICLIGACRTPSTTLENSAGSFGEPVHQFVHGAPDVLVDGDRVSVGSVGLGHEHLILGPDGVFQSATLHFERGFDQVLMSWNVAVPDGAGAALEVAILEAPGSYGVPPAWSPWLRLGDWGNLTGEDPPKTHFDRGAVQIDVLHLTFEAHDLRYRIRAINTQPSDPVRVHRTTLCLSSSEDLRTHLLREDTFQPDHPVQLDVPILSQREAPRELSRRICSPTCVAMALNHAGQSRRPEDVAALLFDAPNEIYGNWVRAAQGAFELGVPSLLLCLSSWEAVDRILNDGVPIIASIKVRAGELPGAPYEATTGHLIVICGLDGEGGVIVNDPAATLASGVRRTYRMEDLRKVWMAKGGVAYLVGR